MLESEGFDNWIENFLALNDLELRCDKTGVKSPTTPAIIKYLQIGIVLIDLHGYTRLELPWQKVSNNTSRNDYKQEDENDEWQTYSYNAPVIEKVELDFVRVCVIHQRGCQLSIVRQIDQIALLRSSKTDRCTAKTGSKEGQNQKSMFKPTKATLRW